MRRMFIWGRILLAGGTAGLGVVELLAGDFIGRWEPVLASIPLHRAFARLSGLVLVVCGASLAGQRTMHAAALALALFLLLWVVALHGPVVAAAPFNVGGWLYLGEVLAIACGALMLWATPGHKRAAMAAQRGFAISLLTFGASHFAYLKETASMVPPYVPAPMAVAGITGAAHLLAGAALLSNLFPRLAVTLEAAMMSAFILLVNLPHVLSTPAHRGTWVALLAEGALVGAAWIVAVCLGEAAAGGNR
jgi:uncharacterized membrane protein